MDWTQWKPESLLSCLFFLFFSNFKCILVWVFTVYCLLRVSLDYSWSELSVTRFLFKEKLHKYATKLSWLVIKAYPRPPATKHVSVQSSFQDKTYIPSHHLLKKRDLQRHITSHIWGLQRHKMHCLCRNKHQIILWLITSHVTRQCSAKAILVLLTQPHYCTNINFCETDPILCTQIKWTRESVL